MAWEDPWAMLRGTSLLDNNRKDNLNHKDNPNQEVPNHQAEVDRIQ